MSHISSEAFKLQYREVDLVLIGCINPTAPNSVYALLATA